MQLFHAPYSSNARRVVMTAHILETPLELVEVDLMDEGARRRLVELNPNSKVPVLADGGFVLWESCAIMQYLAELAPQQTLYPQDPQARGDVHRWMFWACQHWSPAIGVMTWENVWKGLCGAGAPDPAELARGEREVLTVAAVLDAHLAGRDWVAGKALSLADLAIAPAAMYLEPARLPLERFTHLMAWLERVRALDAWQATEVSMQFA